MPLEKELVLKLNISWKHAKEYLDQARIDIGGSSSSADNDLLLLSKATDLFEVDPDKDNKVKEFMDRQGKKSKKNAAKRQMEANAAAAARQRQAALEQRELKKEETLERRKERRAKYETYLEEYSMTVGPEDLVCRPVSESSEHDDNHMLLTLPATTLNSPCRRAVEATCLICTMPYEQGDKVTWSSRGHECSHAFHSDCILTWLSRGKKRCPLCRFFFVPGRPVDGVKVILDVTEVATTASDAQELDE